MVARTNMKPKMPLSSFFTVASILVGLSTDFGNAVIKCNGAVSEILLTATHFIPAICKAEPIYPPDILKDIIT
jgi:hypothetical protein